MAKTLIWLFLQTSFTKYKTLNMKLGKKKIKKKKKKKKKKKDNYIEFFNILLS